MPSDEVLKKLADIVKTDHRRNRLLVELEEVAVSKSKIAQTSQNGEKNFDYKNYPELANIAKELNGVLGITFNQAPTEEFIENLKSELVKIPELVAECPARIYELMNNPNPDASHLLDQIISTVKEPVIVAVKPTNAFVSGTSLSYKGRYVDLSLNRIIKDMIYA